MKPGDYVNILDMEGGGTIVRVLSKGKMEVLLDNGFTVRVSVTQLQPSEAPIASASIPKKPSITIPPTKVDLHIEQLVTHYEHLTNSEKVLIQLEEFERQLSAAMAAGMLEITFIHGIGTGVLRKEIHKRLRENKDVKSFSDAQFDRGATLVKLY